MKILFNFLKSNAKTFLIILLIPLTCLCGKFYFERQNAHKEVIKVEKQLVLEKQKTDSLQQLFIKIANQPACSYSVTFEIKNTAVMGKVSNIDIKPISEAVMTVLKKDLLDNNNEQNKKLNDLKHGY